MGGKLCKVGSCLFGFVAQLPWFFLAGPVPTFTTIVRHDWVCLMCNVQFPKTEQACLQVCICMEYLVTRITVVCNVVQRLGSNSCSNGLATVTHDDLNLVARRYSMAVPEFLERLVEAWLRC